jgi:hypothetical protein
MWKSTVMEKVLATSNLYTRFNTVYPVCPCLNGLISSTFTFFSF